MNWRGALHHLHVTLGRSRTLTRLAVKGRNQLGAIVAAHVAVPSASGEANGEYLLARAVASGCETFVDVGANVGEWTDALIEGAGRDVRGLLFEPNHESFVALEAKYGSNRNVCCMEQAVADFEGTGTFFEEPGRGRTSSLTQANARSDAIKRNVAITTLDKELASRGWGHVDVLKIDAEGHDFFVLRGARNALSAGKVHVLQFECALEWAASGATLEGAYNFLRSFDYSVYMLRADGLYRFDVRRYGETFAYANFVAVAPGQEFRIRSLLQGEW